MNQPAPPPASRLVLVWLQKVLGLMIPFAVAGFGIYYVMQDIPFGSLSDAAKKAWANVAWLPLVGAVLAYLALALLHGLRFSKFVGVSVQHGTAIYAVATMLSTFIPARAGDLYKPHQSSRHSQQGFAAMTGRVLSDLVVWGAGFVVWLIPMIPFGLPLIQAMPMLKWGLLLQVVGSIAGLGAAVAIDVYVRKHQIEPKWAPLRKVLDLAASLREGVSVQRVRSVAVYVMLGWGCEILIPYFVAKAFQLDISLIQGALMMMAVTVAMVVPSPGGVGPFDAAATTTFVSYGAEKPMAAFLALAYHLVFLALPFAVGLVAWIYEARTTAKRATTAT